MWYTSTLHCECNKVCESDEYLIIKNCSWAKPLIDKVLLTYGNEILNTAKASLDDKSVTCKISNCLIHTISLVIICLLILVAVFISCFFIIQNIDQNKNIYYHFTKPTIIKKT